MSMINMCVQCRNRAFFQYISKLGWNINKEKKQATNEKTKKISSDTEEKKESIERTCRTGNKKEMKTHIHAKQKKD